MRELAAKYKIGVDVVLQTLDKFVPVIDDAMRRRLVGREISSLEDDVVFQHPSTWFLNGDIVAESLPHIEEVVEANSKSTTGAAGDA